jgi:ABC-2 type transport system permease protein
MLTSSMVHGTRIWQLPPADLLTAVLVGVAYLGLGIWVMERCERRARDRGLLGHY